MFNTKQRFCAFLGFLLFSLISVAVCYTGIYLILVYFKYAPSVAFSIWSVFAIFFPLFFMPYGLMLAPVFLRGKTISTKAGKVLIKFSLTFIALTVIGMTSFSIFYEKSLEDKGYIQCRGIPSGWTPGMATKYVTDESLCYK